VSYDKAKAYAEELGFEYHEVSANENRGVGEAMQSLATGMIDKYEQVKMETESEKDEFMSQRLSVGGDLTDPKYRLEGGNGGFGLECCMSRDSGKTPKANQSSNCC
jgi:hypothetical protein